MLNLGVRERLRAARANTDALLGAVCPDAWYERPIAERNRIIFYHGHLEAFDWNLIGRQTLDAPAFHPTFDQLFAFGIDPGGDNLPGDRPSDWPHVEEVAAYRARVRASLDSLLAHAPEQLLHVAIEHRLMHAETFAYMMHNLPYASKVPDAQAEAPELPEAAALENPMVEVPGQSVRLGRERGEGFGWDNEFESQQVEVPAFSASRYKITNREYLRFVEAGMSPPHFWVRRGDRWFWRGMFREIPLPGSWPVYVTLREALAYAEFVGKRLATEAEYHACAGHAAPAPSRDNFDFQRWDPAPVNAGGVNGGGPVQVVGNGWEWTATPFAPLPGFAPFPFYPGYSANFFDGEHYVLKGASPRTAACFSRPSFRNWFRASYPYVYAGFRLVED